MFGREAQRSQGRFSAKQETERRAIEPELGSRGASWALASPRPILSRSVHFDPQRSTHVSPAAEEGPQLHLEVMLAHYVQGTPSALKADPRVNAAVTSLLDQMVERGSAAAFRMRDDFVTHAA